MKKGCVYLFIFALIILNATLLRGEVVDRIIIVVNDEVITQGEVDRLLAPIYEQYRNIYQGERLKAKLEEARKGVEEKLIEDRLLLGEAKKLNIEFDEKEVDAKIEDIQRRIGSKDKFDKALMEQGMTVKDLRARYREQIIVRRLINQKIGSRVEITPVETADYYNKNINDFTQPEEVKVWNILIKPKEGFDAKKALNLAKEILNRLHEGGDFAGLAKVYSEGPNASEGGLMGFVKKGDLLPAIEKVVFSLKEGETSDIIQTNLGYHIFKVGEKIAPKVPPLSEVRRDVEEAIFRDKTKGKVEEWIKSLKKNAYIAFK